MHNISKTAVIYRQSLLLMMVVGFHCISKYKEHQNWRWWEDSNACKKY